MVRWINGIAMSCGLASYENMRTGKELTLCRARRQAELPTVLVVAPTSEYPSVTTLARLEHEYSLRDELDSDWAVHPLTLTHHEGRIMLVLEDPGGEPICRPMAGGIRPARPDSNRPPSTRSFTVPGVTWKTVSRSNSSICLPIGLAHTGGFQPTTAVA